MRLDIVVPHYNEPWEECSKLFESLAMQRYADFNDFQVLLVNDGEGHSLISQIAARNYPYRVTEFTIPHGGVSAARNCGLELSKADWIMFCDCDDVFANIYAMKCILPVLDTDRHDLLWSPFYVEVNPNGDVAVKDQFNQLFIHAKIFRRRFLIENKLRFNTDLEYSEDTAFCTVACMCLAPERIGKINCSVIPYTWTYRKGSATTDLTRAEKNAVSLFRRQAYVARELKMRNRMHEAMAMAYRALCDAYVILNRTDFHPDDRFVQEVRSFRRKWYDCEYYVDEETKVKAIESAMKEAYAAESVLPDKDGFQKWLAGINFSQTEV